MVLPWGQSPLGPTLTNIFMGFVEAKIISSFKYKLRYFRYVNDYFILAKNKEVVDDLFTILNDAHNAIKFTVEKKINYGLAFFDILFKRQKNRFLTSVFRK